MTTDKPNVIPLGSHEENRYGGHHPFHDHLLGPVPRYPTGPQQERLPLSGIILPTDRRGVGSSGFALASRFATQQNARLVVIRSGPASERPFQAAMVPRTSERTLVIDLPAGAENILSFCSNKHLVPRLHRQNDVGFKRNLGLLLARMCGWDVALYLDDDIRPTPATQPVPSPARSDPLIRINDVLADFATHPHLHAAGYVLSNMNDNSVVCHARRLVGRPQGIFVGAGALAVRVGGPLPFFSQAYNEDWLFFLTLMLNGRHACPTSAVRYVDTIHQDPYNPFTVARARAQELGDVLAEGVFPLLSGSPEDLVSTASSVDYWDNAIDQRSRMISDVAYDLHQRARAAGPGVMADAEQALLAALGVYAQLPSGGAEALADFFDAFITDQNDAWPSLLETATPAPGHALSMEEAVDVLGLSRYARWHGGTAANHSARWVSPPRRHSSSEEVEITSVPA